MDGILKLADSERLAFEDIGDGPAVVLLHPGLWDMRTSEPQMATFPADQVPSNSVRPTAGLRQSAGPS